MNEIWTTEEESRRLGDRFAAIKKSGISQAKFAEDEKFPGGRSMVNQNIKGHRPITLEAAAIYARYFKCGLHEISPRLAEGVSFASSMQNQPLAPVQQAHTAIKYIATIENVLAALSSHLEQVDAGKRTAAAALLSVLSQSPGDPAIIAAIAALLQPQAFTQQHQKAA